MTTTWQTFAVVHQEVDPKLNRMRKAEDDAFYSAYRRPDDSRKLRVWSTVKKLLQPKSNRS